MIVPQTDRGLEHSPGQEVAKFKISDADAAHVIGVLRDGIYSDKVLAVLREYGANAQDSHRDPMAPPGSLGRPIRVRLPTFSDPTLEYARGLGDRVVVCAVCPSDVVCVPKDSSQQKVRCCRYEVVGLYGERLPDTLFEVHEPVGGGGGAGDGQGTTHGPPAAQAAAPAPVAAPEYTAQGLMALSLPELRGVAVGLGIVTSKRTATASKYELVVGILKVVEQIRAAG